MCDSSSHCTKATRNCNRHRQYLVIGVHENHVSSDQEILPSTVLVEDSNKRDGLPRTLRTPTPSRIE